MNSHQGPVVHARAQAEGILPPLGVMTGTCDWDLSRSAIVLSHPMLRGMHWAEARYHVTVEANRIPF